MSRSITVTFAQKACYPYALFRFDDGSAAITVPELPEMLVDDDPEVLWSQTLSVHPSPWMYALAADNLEAMCRANKVEHITYLAGEHGTGYAVKRRFTVYQRTAALPDEAMLRLAAKHQAAILRVTSPSCDGTPLLVETLLAFRPTPPMRTVYDGLCHVQQETLLLDAAQAMLTQARSTFWEGDTKQRIQEVLRRSSAAADAPRAPDRPRFHSAYPICMMLHPLAGLDPEALKEWMETTPLPNDPERMTDAVCQHLRTLLAQETPAQYLAGKRAERTTH